MARSFGVWRCCHPSGYLQIDGIRLCLSISRCLRPFRDCPGSSGTGYSVTRVTRRSADGATSMRLRHAPHAIICRSARIRHPSSRWTLDFSALRPRMIKPPSQAPFAPVPTGLVHPSSFILFPHPSPHLHQRVGIDIERHHHIIGQRYGGEEFPRQLSQNGAG